MQQVRVKYLRRAELHSRLTETPRPLRPSERERVEPGMATDFTQDAVLHFLQSSGGSVKNSDLLLHFKFFLREHADRNRNRDLFKKYVNSVATVKQEQGVSYVILRKKFRGHVPGGGGVASSGPPRPPAGRKTEPSPEKGNPNPAGSREQSRLKPPLREETTPAPLGDSAKKTILPAAGIMLNNNNNVETNLNLKQQQQVISKPKSARPAAAQEVSHTLIPKKTKVKTPTLPEPPTRDQRPKLGQNRVGFALPPGNTPAVGHHGATSEQDPVPVPETLRGREAIQQPGGGLHQDPALHHISPQSQVTPRRARCRKSYKSAVSHDEYEEEEEEVPVRRGSTEGVWPLSTPLGHSDRVLSASSPCIIDPPAHHSAVSSSSPLERKPPKIYIQDVEGETLPPGGPGRSSASGAAISGHWAGPGREPGSVPGDAMSTRRSLPLEAERYTPSLDRAEEAAPHRKIHPGQRYSQPAGVQPEDRPGSSQSQKGYPEEVRASSQGGVLSPSSDTSFSSDWPSSGSPRGSGWNSSYEDPQARAGETVGVVKVQEVLQRAQAPKPEPVTHRADSKTTTPWHHSTGHLHNDQKPTACVSPLHFSTGNLHDNQQSTPLSWHSSTGDLHQDAEDAESSDGSTCSPPARLRPAVAKRLSSKLRSRMCRSLGANLDELLEEEARKGGGGGGGRGGSEAARLNRLHLISSSLSLHCNLSSSSLSSCSTPPRCHSLADLAEAEGERKGGRRSLPHESPGRQSLVPLESREHVWLVKGAAGVWPDIYSLFREDSSLLNRRDFISGFTVLHWIAKHGDHRVLNTLWYGVQKAGLTFDINARSSSGYTPLHVAAIHGNKNIMRLLVKKFGADVKLRDTAGKRPWHYLSRTAPPDIFQLLGAPARASLGEGAGAGRVDRSLEQQQQQQHRRRRRHHLSSASSGERPLTVAGLTKVKRSSSFAAFLKHKSLRHLHGHQSDSSV